MFSLFISLFNMFSFVFLVFCFDFVSFRNVVNTVAPLRLYTHLGGTCVFISTRVRETCNFSSIFLFVWFVFWENKSWKPKETLNGRLWTHYNPVVQCVFFKNVFILMFNFKLDLDYLTTTDMFIYINATCYTLTTV